MEGLFAIKSVFLRGHVHLVINISSAQCLSSVLSIKAFSEDILTM